MLRESYPARRKARRGFVSNAVSAIALALCGTLAAGGLTTPAFAQEEPVYTKAFVEAYEPVKAAFDAAADAAAAEPARALVPAMLATITNNDERFAAGGMLIQLGLKLSEPTYQRDGLKLQLDSGQLTIDRQQLFNYYYGSFAWDARDYAVAREFLQKSYDLGHKAANLERLIAETYFAQGQTAEGLAVLDRMIGERGNGIAEDTYRRALQVVLDEGLSDQLVKRSADLVRYHPSEATWNAALRVVLESFDMTADESVDLFRLMKLTNSLQITREYVDYVEAADARRMANEVLPVLQEGVRLGLLNDQDVFVKEALEVATARAPEDAAAAEEDAASARAATDAISARAAADNYFALGNFAGAEEIYKLALQRAPDDADRLNMRIGISQTRQGKFAEARQSFGAVGGKRANVAAMWLAYIDLQPAG